MRSFLKDYSKFDNMTNEYNPVKMVNKDLDKHPDWKIIQIVSSDNYHFYVVYEIKVPRKPRAKKGEPAPIEVPYVAPTLETIEQVDESKVQPVAVEEDSPTDTIPKMVDLVKAIQ